MELKDKTLAPEAHAYISKIPFIVSATEIPVLCPEEQRRARYPGSYPLLPE